MVLGTRQGGLALGLAVVAFGLLSCVAPGGGTQSYSWFESPREEDPWRKPILDWQGRLRTRDQVDAAATDGPEKIVEPSTLAVSYEEFHRSERRRIAASITLWIQEQARLHFVPDPGIDIWPTPQEVLETGGDDCDGLAFVTHRMLLDLGFREENLYLAIVRRDSDALHHMVGLWFGDGQDPWVIDPTGAMAREMIRMSSVSEWQPLAVFSEKEHFRALPQVAAASPPPSKP